MSSPRLEHNAPVTPLRRDLPGHQRTPPRPEKRPGTEKSQAKHELDKLLNGDKMSVGKPIEVTTDDEDDVLTALPASDRLTTME